jgi:acetoacetate decarboxylase
MRNVEILTAFYRTEPASIAALLPSPLEPTTDVVAIHIYRMNDTDHFGRYHESAFQLGARLPGTTETGAYSPYLFLDNDGAIAAGREVYGQPKKFGRPRIKVRQDTIIGSVERNGITFTRITAPYKQRRATRNELTENLAFVTNINYRVLPSADGGMVSRELTARELEDVEIHECWRGPGTIELRPHIQAPVYRLPVLQELDVFYWRCTFTLGPGRVIYDYLDPGRTSGL